MSAPPPMPMMVPSVAQPIMMGQPMMMAAPQPMMMQMDTNGDGIVDTTQVVDQFGNITTTQTTTTKH